MRAENANDHQDNASIAQTWARMPQCRPVCRLVRSILSESLPRLLLAPFKNAQEKKSLIPKASPLQHCWLRKSLCPCSLLTPARLPVPGTSSSQRREAWAQGSLGSCCPQVPHPTWLSALVCGFRPQTHNVCKMETCPWQMISKLIGASGGMGSCRAHLVGPTGKN